ncbi:hypothetical protein [Streptomyces sp. NPDC018610]|uniref:hypothetical protein n=1 Tax=Streptomyces sp. NPDC018610 TaxID=3365049 RepID=UPI0037AC7679
MTRQLETLRQEETLLLDILDLAGHPAAASDTAHVPQQARNEPTPRPATEEAPAVSAATSAPGAPAVPDATDSAPAEHPAPAKDETALATTPDAAPKTAPTAAPKAGAKKRTAKSTAAGTGRNTARSTAKTAKTAKTATKNTVKSTEGTTSKSAGKSTGRSAGKAAAKKDEPQVLLRDLLLDLLGGHSEPRLAAELREELLSKHPDREPTPQVVRNTLEALVAKGRIQRHKQGRSVMYTLVGPEQEDAQAGAA